MAGWFLDIHLRVLLSWLEKFQKEREILFLLPLQKASRIWDLNTWGSPCFSHTIRDLCFEKSWTLKDRSGGLWLKSGVCKGTGKGFSSPQKKGRGNNCLHASRRHLSADGPACGRWIRVLSSKRCVLGKGSWGSARRDGVFGFKWTSNSWILSISVASSLDWWQETFFLFWGTMWAREEERMSEFLPPWWARM